MLISSSSGSSSSSSRSSSSSSSSSLREFVLCQRNDLFEPGRGEGILQITPSWSAKLGKAGQNRAKPGKIIDR